MKGNKTGGRAKGSKNKTTAELKEFINAFIADNLEDMQAQYNSLDAYKKFEVMDKLMKYVLPSRPLIEIDSLAIQFNSLPLFVDNKVIDLTSVDNSTANTPYTLLRSLDEIPE